MNPHIVIAIQDTNRFFSLGIQHILQAYLLDKGYTWNFVPFTSRVTVDLIVLAKSVVWLRQPSFLSEKSENAGLGTIVIQETVAEHVKQEKLSGDEPAILGRREGPDAFLRLVAEMLDQASPRSLVTREQTTGSRLTLTPREREVLQGISWELTPGQIAKKLTLSVKTVSTHKLTAMRKLGFKRNSELYHWLRQGGLVLESGVLPAC